MLTCPDQPTPSGRTFADLRRPWHRTAAVAAVALFLAGSGATAAHAATGETARFGAALGTIANPSDPAAAPERLVPSGIAADQVTGKVYVATRGADSSVAGPIFVFTETGAPAGQVDLELAEGYAQTIAVDGPAKKLLIGTFDGVFGNGLSVVSVPTDDLTAVPTTVIGTDATGDFYGNASLAVDQSTAPTLGGRIFVGFSASDPELIGDPASPTSGFVAEFSKTGTFVRKIGTPVPPAEVDPAAQPVAGKFDNGDIARLAVATDTHTLSVQGASLAHTFASTGTATSVRKGVEEAFALGADGSLWYREGADAVEPLLRLAPGGATPFQIPGAGGTTTPVPGQAAKSCQLDAAAIGAAGPGASAYFAASSADRTMIVRIGAGGQGCGLDPALSTATASNTKPETGTAVQLTATGTSPEGLGLTYEWDLDGSAATGAQGFETTTTTGATTVTPSKAGVLAIRVRLRDAQGSISAVRALDVDVAAASGGGGGLPTPGLPTPAPTATPKPSVPNPTPAPTQAPLSQPVTTPTPAPPAPKPTTSLKGSVAKGVTVKLTCTVACTGKVALTSSKGVVLAKGTYSKTKAGTVSVKLKLTKAGKKALAKSTKAKATLVVTPATGTATSTKVSLRLSRG